MIVTPNYYKHFNCIADKCKHSCCVGWEIDIDEYTLEYYENLVGDIGEMVRKNISYEGDPHFCLRENDRCPFLNDKNLCELILSLGEDSLCQICTDHPRFRNELGDREEIGLGLCCEEACRLILGQDEDFALEYEGEDIFDDDIIALRDRAIEIMQQKGKSIDERCDEVLSFCGFDYKLMDARYMLKLLMTLDALDNDWIGFVGDVYKNYSKSDSEFSKYVKDDLKMYEKLIIYFLYRYMANAQDAYEAGLRAAFAVSVYRVIFAMSGYIYKKQGSFELCDMVELCRRFSSEVEYDLDNLEIYMEEFYEHNR